MPKCNVFSTELVVVKSSKSNFIYILRSSMNNIIKINKNLIIVLLYLFFCQAFVRISHDNSEIIFVAEADSNLLYKFDLDINGKAKDFGSRSGKYGIHLIIGDSVISNSVAWHLADINLKFSGDEEAQQVLLFLPRYEQ